MINVSMELPTIPLSSKRILVVDDSADIREIIGRVLEIEGYVVLQAANGIEALKILQWGMPDLILSDVQMPEMDGMDFYHQVHTLPGGAAVPFIFITSSTSPELMRQARDLGIEDFLIKPVDSDLLVRVVHGRLLRTAQVQIAYMDRAYLETVNVLANTIESRDACTYGHVERVARYARWLAEAIEWPQENLRILEFGARLHDIGKIVVPDHILNKPGPLLPEEREIMRSHTVAGARILHNISHLQPAIPYVLFHHEKWDGTGYPQGLKGRDIPLEGRLVAIADVYDALTTRRPYHPPRPHQEVIRFLKLCAGVQFDPELTALFIMVLEKRAERQPNSLLGQDEFEPSLDF